MSIIEYAMMIIAKNTGNTTKAERLEVLGDIPTEIKKLKIRKRNSKNKDSH